MMEDISNIESSISQNHITVNRRDYNALLLEKLKRNLFVDTYKFMHDFKSSNPDEYAEKVFPKIEGCNGILDNPEIRILEFDYHKICLSKHLQTKKSRIQKTYLIYDPNSKYYKIGKSKDPELRIQSINTPGKLILVHVINLDIENMLHKHF